MGFRLNNLLSIISFISILAGASLLAKPLCAEELLKKMTQENVTAFIQEATEITAGKREDMTPEQIAEFLDRHLEKKAHFKSLIKYNIPGYPPQDTTMSLDKKEYIEGIAKGKETLEGYESEILIKSVKILKNGTEAMVQTNGYEAGIMPMPVEGGTTKNVPMEGNSICSQILVLNDGIIQMYGANCETVVNFMPDN